MKEIGAAITKFLIWRLCWFCTSCLNAWFRTIHLHLTPCELQIWKWDIHSHCRKLVLCRHHVPCNNYSAEVCGRREELHEIMLWSGTLLREKDVSPVGLKNPHRSLGGRELPIPCLNNTNNSASICRLGSLPSGISLASHCRHQFLPASSSTSVDPLDWRYWSPISFGLAFLQQWYSASSSHCGVHCFGHPNSVERCNEG